MPNKIMIQSLLIEKRQSADNHGIERGNDVMVFPLQEDIRIEATSEIASWADVIPSLDLLEKFTTLTVASTGSVSKGLLNLTNMANAPRWQKTNPIQITATLGFYLVDNPLKNIYAPMKKLIGLSILSTTGKKENTKIIPPGLFLPAASAAGGDASEGSAQFHSAKLIAVKIPGIIFLPAAMIVQAIPTYSKHITESGYPLWGTIELTITGLFPAFEEHFNADDELGDPMKRGNSNLVKNIKNIKKKMRK